MKNRKNTTGKLKQFYAQHTNAIQNTGISLIIIALIIAGFLVSWFFFNKPLDDEQFKLCEQVAQQTYEARDQFLIEEKEGFKVQVSQTSIEVMLDNYSSRGKIVAKLQNGEFIMNRDLQTREAIISSVLAGFLFVCIGFLLILLIANVVYFMKKLH